MSKEFNFQIFYTEHEKEARETLLSLGIASADKLALMTSQDIKNAINQNFRVFPIYKPRDLSKPDTWLLIPNDRCDDFDSYAVWIDRQ